MQKDSISHIFNDLHGQFDVKTPNAGHEGRFLEKLVKHKALTKQIEKTATSRWKTWVAIAASVSLFIGVFSVIKSKLEPIDLASVSPTLSETQDFFTTTIQAELKKLNQERSPLTQSIIIDALDALESLEQDYDNLKISLTENANDQRVIYAMINNFQNRIAILNNVLEEIEKLKQLQINTYETTNSI